jgi:DNA-binding beta-propeller fold protein YncE
MLRALKHAIILGAVSCLPALSIASMAPATPTFVLSWGTAGPSAGQFNQPSGIATDPLGNVYVADRYNNRIQAFDRFGNLIRQWGAPGSGNGQFNEPFALAIDPSGNVYVAEYAGNRVQKFTSAGAYLLQWGSPGSGNIQFNHATGIATDAAGNVYVVDQYNYRVQKFSGTGGYLGQFGSWGTGPGQLMLPMGIAVDATGNVYVGDFGNSRIQKFSSTGAYLLQLGSGPGNGMEEFDHPYGVAVDAVGNLYVADTNNHRIQVFNATGGWRTMWGSLGTGTGQFAYPFGVATDASGNLYVADTFNNRVQKFSAAGAGPPTEPAQPFALTWGSFGTGNGQFNAPVGVATDPSGNVYVSDSHNYRVEEFNGAGTYLTQWGTYGSGTGQFIEMSNLAVDGAGNVYVLDSSIAPRVEKFSSTGAFLTQWSGSGGAAGLFAYPRGIAVDASGNVYVADTGNRRIQKFTSAGAPLAQWGSAGSGNGQFLQPQCVAVDAAGNVYVSDVQANRIQKFTSSGAYVTQWGSTGSGDGQFISPSGIAVDAAGKVYVTDATARVQKFSGTGAYLSQWGSPGSAAGRFNNPQGIAVDAAGNVFVADYANHRIQKFAGGSPPEIALISDVGNDQGRQVRLRILRASADGPGSSTPVLRYDVYRRIDPLGLTPGAARAASPEDALSGMPRPAGVQLAGWEQVGSIPARGDAEYNIVVPTLADATPASFQFTAFFVSAATANPLNYIDSGVELGFSVDNLSPPAPTPFAAAFAAGATHLHWGVSAATDFASFHLYRGATAGFTPGPGNMIAATTDTGYVDAGAAGQYYKLGAADFNGNEGPYALAGPAQTLDVPATPAVPFALDGARPNPAPAGRMSVAFSLPSAEPARLEVLDVSGRRVLERAVGELGAGHHVVDLSEGCVLPAGLYLVKLTQGGRSSVTRVATLP